MSDNVIPLPGANVPAQTHIAPERVIGGLAAAELREICAVGYDADGKLVVVSSEGAADTLWLLNMGVRWLLNGGQGDE